MTLRGVIDNFTSGVQSFAKESALEIARNAPVLIPGALAALTGIQAIPTVVGVAAIGLNLWSTINSLGSKADDIARGRARLLSWETLSNITHNASQLVVTAALAYTTLHKKSSFDEETSQVLDQKLMLASIVLLASSVYSGAIYTKQAFDNFVESQILQNVSPFHEGGDINWKKVARGISSIVYSFFSIANVRVQLESIHKIKLAHKKALETFQKEKEARSNVSWRDIFTEKRRIENKDKATKCWTNPPWENQDQEEIAKLQKRVDQQGYSTILSVNPKRPEGPLDLNEEYFESTLSKSLCHYMPKGGEIKDTCDNAAKIIRSTILKNTEYTTQCEFEESLSRSIAQYNDYLTSLELSKQRFSVYVLGEKKSNKWVLELALKYFKFLPDSVEVYSKPLEKVVPNVVYIDDGCYSGSQALDSLMDLKYTHGNEVTIKSIIPFVSNKCLALLDVKDLFYDRLIPSYKEVDEVTDQLRIWDRVAKILSPKIGNTKGYVISGGEHLQLFDHKIADGVSLPSVLSDLKSSIMNHRETMLEPYKS